MKLIKLNDQGGVVRYPYTLRMLKKDYPNVSLPKNPDNSTLISLGVMRVGEVTKPTGDVVTEGAPVQMPDGTWLQTWESRSYTVEETAAALESAKARKLEEINKAYEADMSVILNEYPEAETKTWITQEAEAKAWIADNTVSTPMLTEMATVRNVTMAYLTERVLQNASLWKQMSGSLTGKRHGMEDAISAATTVADVELIAW